eukprot:9479193-Pyramimonas_sp.AAC.1
MPGFWTTATTHRFCHLAHVSHQLTSLVGHPGFVFCRRCSLFGRQAFPSRMFDECPGVPRGPYSRRVLERLRLGEYPYSVDVEDPFDAPDGRMVP